MKAAIFIACISFGNFLYAFLVSKDYAAAADHSAFEAIGAFGSLAFDRMTPR